MAAAKRNHRGRVAKDEVGNKYGRLTVLERVFDGCGGTGPKWRCRCECGNICVVNGSRMRQKGRPIGCGCQMSEARRKNGRTPKRADGPRIKSGCISNSREYLIRLSMINRCYYSSATGYEYYGGRGITVCQRWLESFENFIADMGPCPSKQHSIDRYPNNDGNYEPGNCRWATKKQQGNNQRTNRPVTFDGETHTVAEWMNILGTTRYAVLKRERRLALQ